MAKSFVHLHNHMNASTLDGLSTVKGAVAAAGAMGQPAIAITDHGSMAATYDLYKAAKGSEVRPIFGIEAYLAPGVSRTHREPVRWSNGGDDDISGNGAYTHMTMLATTDEGLHNLFRISSEAYLTGMYRKPRADMDLLSAFNRGVIATTGCPSGDVQTWLRIGNYANAREAAAQFRDVFEPGNFFVEVMDHGLGIEKRVIADLLRLAKDLNLPVVATNDTHYIRSEDATVHDALLCIGSGSKIADVERFRFDSQDFYLKSAAEMRHIWDAEVPEACDNTLLIAERCEATFHEGIDLMPKFEVPDGHDEASWLRHEVGVGLEGRYPNGVPAEVRDRADYELGIITQMGFPGYFLVTADYINWAKRNGVRVGPGRGSAAGSMVAYAMGITELDPLRHGLLFERFLNPERVSMPDIDVDFDDRNRGRVIEYVVAKYGEDKVAQISTNMVMKAKASIKDAARVLGASFIAGEQLTKAYPPPIVGRDLSLADAFDPNHERYAEAAEFRKMAGATDENRKIVALARGLEGTQRGFGMHAAGVIMSRKPLVDTVPLMRRDTNSPVVTAFEYPTCEKLGLLKMDFLGLSNLGTLDEALRLIRVNRGIDLDLDAIGRDLNDPDTYALIATGETLGVFQLDSAPIRSLLRLMVPTEFEHISAVLALYRPGPMGAGTHVEYAERKNGRKAILPIHKELAEPLQDILAGTFGLIVYQEQVQAIAQRVAGYSLGRADLLRKAMGKKDPAILAQEYGPFRDGMQANGFSDDAVKALWDILVPFSDYAFNKAHTAAYGLVAYWTAYLKTHYPAEYMAALLTTNAGDSDKLALYLGECRRMGIRVLSPDVNASDLNYAAVGDDIRVGLTGVKNVGEGAVNLWLAERAVNGPALDFANFLARAEGALGAKRAVDSLIKAGAFDSMGHPRAALAAVTEDALTRLRKAKKAAEKLAAQKNTLFDDTPVAAPRFTVEIPEIPEWDKREKLTLEREMLGLYVSDHPLADYANAIETLSSDRIAALREAEEVPEGIVTVAGLIASVERKVSKKNAEPWAILTVEDLDSAIQMYVFPRTYVEVQRMIAPDKIAVFTGRAERKDDGSTSIIVKSMSVPDMEAEERKSIRHAERIAAGIAEEGSKPDPRAGFDDGSTTPLVLHVHNDRLTEPVVDALKAILIASPGSRPVHLSITDEHGAVHRMALPDAYAVAGTGHLAAELRALLGAEAL